MGLGFRVEGSGIRVQGLRFRGPQPISFVGLGPPLSRTACTTASTCKASRGLGFRFRA